MKRLAIVGGIALATVVGASTVSAQTTVGGGAKAGVNLATISGDLDSPGTTKSMQTGAIVGGFLTIGFADMYAFQPEVLYSQEGVKATYKQGTTSIEAKNKVGVVQVPLLLRLGRRMMAKNMTPYILVGPEFGFITSAKAEALGVTEDFKSELKSWDASIVFGAGVTTSHFLVEARYGAGLSDINKTGKSTTTNRSNVFSILGGVQF